MRLGCPACGRSDDWRPPQHAVAIEFPGRVEFVSGGAKRHPDKALVIGAPIDRYFHLVRSEHAAAAGRRRRGRVR
jgi:hypothetical protein